MHLFPDTGELQLAEHVRGCRIDDLVVLLDLKANRYVGVPAAASSSWLRHGAGWRCSPEAGERVGSTHAPAESAGQSVGRVHDGVTAQLLSQGLLTLGQSAHASPGAPSHRIDVPTASLDIGDIGDRSDTGTGAPVSPRQLVNFAGSALRAAWWLRTRSLHAIVSIVSRHPGRHPGSQRGAPGPMKPAAVRYERLRPLLLTAHEQCLLDSLALIGFLATEGHFPHWVIGVRTAPFGAHAWVQAGATVLNDQHEYVRAFAPILVV